MQFGIELFGFKWSPIKYIYKQWAGLYSQRGRFLYVNRGFGFIGLKGRIGIWPEVAVITLKRQLKLNDHAKRYAAQSSRIKSHQQEENIYLLKEAQTNILHRSY